MNVKNMHTRLLIFLVCIILGFMITMQLKSHNRHQTVAAQRAEELTVRLKEVQADRDKLAKELDTTINSGETEGKAISLVAETKGKEHSFRVIIAPPEGQSFARDIAEKYGVTYESLTAAAPDA